MRAAGSRCTAVVVGAGIAGLAAAISLARAGWSVTVLERTAELGEVGAGFAMSRNAVAAFRGLAFDDDAVAALGYPTWAEGTWDLRGRRILAVPDTPEIRESVALLGVHRRRLHTALHAKAQDLDVEIVTGTPVAGLDPGSAAGAPALIAGREADLVVGADGMRSALRAALFPGRDAQYSGYSSWRAILPRDGEETLRQYWGPHAEFGAMPVSQTETYWYGYVAMPERMRLTDELAWARWRFAEWTGPVRRILDRTPPEAVMRHDVHHLPGGLPRYARGRVIMIGDAAHGFLPTMGQGAASALEDGLCVGLLIGAPVAVGVDLSAALAGFDAVRRPRCRQLERGARTMARIGSHLGPGWRQGLRNRALRLTPTSAMTRASRAVMDWTPPQAGTLRSDTGSEATS